MLTQRTGFLSFNKLSAAEQHSELEVGSQYDIIILLCLCVTRVCVYIFHGDAANPEVKRRHTFSPELMHVVVFYRMVLRDKLKRVCVEVTYLVQRVFIA